MTNSTAVHWVGAGLASGPGIVSLAQAGVALTVWDQARDRAEMLLKELDGDATFNISMLDIADATSLEAFKAMIEPGDIIVSMLPAALHLQLAEAAIATSAHLVTSSYVSPEMSDLHKRSEAAGVALVNEVGLDPGIDHLFAHLLVDAAESAGMMGQGHDIEFVSYCGGVPAVKTDFTYKFAWTPFGVLTALKNEARFLDDGAEQTVKKAWESVSTLDIFGETFEVYANRDSVPYVEEYGFGRETGLKKFVRGTLRLAGWKEAWKDIFHKVDTANIDELKALSTKLWQDHPYADDEEDRVVLYVAMKATNKAGDVWHASVSLDERGTNWNTAMARTVSLTVSQAVIALMKSTIEPGVHAAITSAAQCRAWVAGLQENGISVKAENVNL